MVESFTTGGKRAKDDILRKYSEIIFFVTEFLVFNVNILKANIPREIGNITKILVSPVGIYMFKVNNTSTKTKCKTCSKLTIKTPE